MEGIKHNVIKELAIEILDMLVREPKMIWRNYRPFKFFHKTPDDVMMYVADGRQILGGMFDRLKGIISLYAIAKAENRNFKIHFNHPFILTDYLVPNAYDWTIAKEEVIFSYPMSRPVFAFGEYSNPHRLLKRRKGQVHYFYGYNSLDYINEKYGTFFDWGELYRELFKPSETLKQYIERFKNEIGKDYIVVHTRFLNLLGDKNEFDINPTLLKEEAQALCQRCIDEVKKIHERHHCRIMIASDSMMFIREIKRQVPEVYVVPGTVSHIGVATSTTDESVIKMFVDYYLIGGAKNIYSIVGPEMWQSAFPEYAAKIGGAAFERIFIY